MIRASIKPGAVHSVKPTSCSMSARYYLGDIS